MKCKKCGCEIDNRMETCPGCLTDLWVAPSTNGLQARLNANAIRKVQHICEEALEHNIPWLLFCRLVLRQLETETVLMPGGLSKLQPPGRKA